MSGWHRNTECTEQDGVDLRRELEKAGWRYTRQRSAVFDYLRQAGSHPTAEEVYAAVRQSVPKISLATVYKALDALVACKLANKITQADGATRYDCRQDPHYHLRSIRSGEIRDLETVFDKDLIHKLDPNLESSLEQQGFHVTGYRLELLGYFKSEDQRERSPRKAQ